MHSCIHYNCWIALVVLFIVLPFIPILVGSFASEAEVVSSSAPFLSDYPRLMPPVRIGDDILISTILKNPTGEDMRINLIIEARNSDGITELMDWVNMTIYSNETEYQTGVGWIPSHLDRYQLRTFVISNFGEDSMVMSKVEVEYFDIES